MDLSQAVANRQAIADIKRRYSSGEITREQAKKLAEPILLRINQRSIEIARKWGKKGYPKQTFIDVMR